MAIILTVKKETYMRDPYRDKEIEEAKNPRLACDSIDHQRPDGRAGNATGFASVSQLGEGINQASTPSHAHHFATLQALKARELLAKVEDLKRFVRENIPGDAGSLAQFKFDEGYLWAKQHLTA
jgi:hypothetical protein